jgi:hypothetical protein
VAEPGAVLSDLDLDLDLEIRSRSRSRNSISGFRDFEDGSVLAGV